MQSVMFTKASLVLVQSKFSFPLYTFLALIILCNFFASFAESVFSVEQLVFLFLIDDNLFFFVSAK